MNTIYANEKSVLCIGMQGETQRTQVVFDFSDVAAEFPGGTVVLLHQPAGQSECYPVSELVVDHETFTATWTIMGYDTPEKGFGECQLIYSTDAVCKSKIWKTLTDRSMTVTTEDVPNWEDLVGALVTAANNVETAISNAQETIAEDLEASQNARSEAVSANAHAQEAASNAEAWAVGKRNGVDVPTSDPTYSNNAEFYARMAQQGAGNSGFIFFDIHDDDGQMYVTLTGAFEDDVSFVINEQTGELEVVFDG